MCAGGEAGVSASGPGNVMVEFAVMLALPQCCM